MANSKMLWKTTRLWSLHLLFRNCCNRIFILNASVTHVNAMKHKTSNEGNGFSYDAPYDRKHFHNVSYLNLHKIFVAILDNIEQAFSAQLEIGKSCWYNKQHVVCVKAVAVKENVLQGLLIAAIKRLLLCDWVRNITALIRRCGLTRKKIFQLFCADLDWYRHELRRRVIWNTSAWHCKNMAYGVNKRSVRTY